MKFNFDTEYIQATLDAYRKMHKARGLRILLKIVSFIGLLALLAIFVFISINYDKSVLFAAAFMVLLMVLLVMSPKLDYWYCQRKLRLSPFNNDAVSVSFDDDGMELVTESSEARWKWNLIERSIFVESGIFVYHNKDECLFVPNKNGVAIDLGALESLLERNNIDVSKR
ncbi:YcxB family protein [Pleionea sp. CnH1-48]|nr:YcxB family protein [Pleionea sp. CnH1-48]